MIKQQILIAGEKYERLDEYLMENHVRRIFLVCSSSFSLLRISKYFYNLLQRTGIEVTKFTDFKPNPLYDSVLEGVKLYHKSESDLIIAIGGGSAMDIAKCIKLYSNMNANRNYLTQIIVPNKVKLLAVPTTAGSGSEATKYAVIYHNGEKQSISDDSCIPSAVLMDASVLTTLPIYQKKSTMMDALCHAIESFWSVNSSVESKRYSREAICMIMSNKELYLDNNETGNMNMLKAAYLAGKAINITQTTAGHAMCYKLTGLYGIAHGHAVALCISKLWPFMVANQDRCIDARGRKYLSRLFDEIAAAMGCRNAVDAAYSFQVLFDSLELTIPDVRDNAEYDSLKKSVNPMRLKNHPIQLDENTINELYHQIFSRRNKR